MRVTIVPDDRVVIVDGVSKTVDVVWPNVHAAQWYNTYGTIEWKNRGATTFTTLSTIAKYVDAWRAV
jgi:hypothetical protein